MSLQAFSPTSSTLLMEEIFTKTMSDVIKNFDTEGLIEYLKRKDLKLDKMILKFFTKRKLLALTFLIQLKKSFKIMV